MTDVIYGINDSQDKMAALLFAVFIFIGFVLGFITGAIIF